MGIDDDLLDIHLFRVEEVPNKLDDIIQFL